MPKFPTLGAAFAVAALFASPAHAQFKIRAGAETQIVQHVNNPDSTTWLTDQWRPSLVGMVGFSVVPFLSLDAEIAQTFIKNSPNLTTIRLGATLEPPVLRHYRFSCRPPPSENVCWSPKLCPLPLRGKSAASSR